MSLSDEVNSKELLWLKPIKICTKYIELLKMTISHLIYQHVNYGVRCLLYMRRDFSSTLDIVNQVLSNIPPYAMYIRDNKIIASNEDKELYESIFQDSDTSVIERAKKAWMFALCFTKNMSDSLPLGINIELYFSDHNVVLLSHIYMCILPPVFVLP